MNTGKLACLLTAALLLLAACGGGGGPKPPPDGNGGSAAAVTLFTYPGNAHWLAAPPGSGLAGTEVKVIADGSEYTITVRHDGSFRFGLGTEEISSLAAEYTAADGKHRSVTPARFSISDHLTHGFVTTGMAPNDMVFAGGRCYVVNSLDNNLAIYDASSFSQVGALVFPQYASPSYLFVNETLGVVTCNGNNAVYVFDPATGNEQWSVELSAEGLAFLGPGRPWADGERIFIPLANLVAFGAPGEPTVYRPAELAIISIDARAFLGTIPLSGLDAVDVEPVGGNLLAVCQAGDLSFDEDFYPFVTRSSFIDVVDTGALSVVATVNLGTVGAGTLLYDEARQRLLVGSLVMGRAYAIDTASWLILRGAPDPIRIGQAATFVSGFAQHGSVIFAASFNEDLVYALDAESYEAGVWPLPAPLPLTQEEVLLAGPQALLVDDDHNALLILEGVANRIAKFALP